MIDFRGLSDKKICVAVSGGVDSTALLAYMLENAPVYGYTLSVCHCEHGLRGEESLADAAFVRALCERYGLPFYFFQENCARLAEQARVSVETAARSFRHAAFAALIQDGRADFIATAHHKNDDAETILFRLARGTSLSGAGGISEENAYLLRPFLSWTRSQIEAYARARGLEHRDDATNFETIATRNKLRLDVLPRLETAIPGATENLLRFSRLAAEDDRLLYSYAERLLSADNAVAFCQEKPLFRRAALLALKNLGLEKDYTTRHLEAAYDLQTAERGARLCFPKNILAEKTENGIRFYRKKTENIIEEPSLSDFNENGFDGGMYAVSISDVPFENDENSLRIDADKLPKTAVFRFRREGDSIVRFGGGRKSLKKFFNEKKIPVSERAHIPLIAEPNGGEVYVACGVEISERVRVDETTKRTLYIMRKKKTEGERV